MRSSLPKDTDLESVTLNQAIELIKEALEKKAKQEIKTFNENPEVKVLEGRYGPYVRFGKKIYAFLKKQNPKILPMPCVLNLMHNQSKNAALERKEIKPDAKTPS